MLAWPTSVSPPNRRPRHGVRHADRVTLVEPNDVSRLVERELGEPVTSVVEMAGSVTNRSYRVDTGTGPMVMKTCPEHDWINETTALSTLAAAPSVPTAALLASGDLDGLPWLILRWVDGEPAGDAQARRTAGPAVSELHQHRADHFGPPSDPATSWADVLHRGLDAELRDVVSAGLLSATDASAVQRAVAAIPAYRGEPRLLHGDLKDVHLRTHGAALAALLDWGDASAGHPIDDLARGGAGLPPPLHRRMPGHRAARRRRLVRGLPGTHRGRPARARESLYGTVVLTEPDARLSGRRPVR
ncbi:phosphotransferase [Arsenicicoccus piscis]|uniref:phosphotransferase n=1 Tax=Arsenicicoccus piscis TaxID=673954 RepID=UPI003D6681B5